MAKKRILVIDDEINLTQMVKLNLEAAGDYEVETENEGANAIEVAKRFKPDLIFLDLIMPDIEGSEVARHLKAERELKNVPIVFFTATITSEEVKRAGGVVGGQTFLAKPVSLKQLIECIERCTGQKGRAA